MAALEPTIGAGKEYPILWWTDWFWRKEFEGRVIDFCGLPYTCKMTHDRSIYKDTSTLIFHASVFELATGDTPPLEDSLRPKKAWIMKTLEAPLPIQRDPYITSIFTHLWSYYRHADFVETYFNGGRDSKSFIASVFKKPAFTIEEKNQRRKEGLAPIAWIVSNCRAHSFRHFFVKQLLKYIDVDIYGRCLANKEWPKNPDGSDMNTYGVVAPYKFYLAIENNNCDDYVTEKLERPIAMGVVPIIDGPEDYTPYIPNNKSAIKIDDFGTPARLAQYIHELDKDDKAYSGFLEYKSPTEEQTKTLSHLGPKFVETYDTGDAPNQWGFDGLGAECRICEMTHNLAEGITTLDPNHRLPAIDRTCNFNKWGNVAWGIDFYFTQIMITCFVLTLVTALLVKYRRFFVLIIHMGYTKYLAPCLKKCLRRRKNTRDALDESQESLIPLSNK
ncbi:Alpha-(1,3)-fucosyltransferase 11 [Lunasporangiospora selenospora]|uniref:Fucosyltransferase n=1 Tax=Lunasporangiospora selenospora TaxID=979761 RepID=A0A9P6FSE6_9FUNG|nr:Alpha-(1,3)-fucosyltransferase 11 [Lunasporangiospora selenospora]